MNVDLNFENHLTNKNIELGEQFLGFPRKFEGFVECKVKKIYRNSVLVVLNHCRNKKDDEKKKELCGKAVISIRNLRRTNDRHEDLLSDPLYYLEFLNKKRKINSEQQMEKEILRKIADGDELSTNMHKKIHACYVKYPDGKIKNFETREECAAYLGISKGMVYHNFQRREPFRSGKCKGLQIFNRG